jgi:hypothetical protein
MEQESLIQRLRDSFARLGRTPLHPAAPQSDIHIRDSIRQLSRARVSEILRQLRAAHGLAYADVQSQTGLSQQLLFDIEYKDRRLTLDELRRLAACYQVSVDDILGIDLD